MQRVFDHTQAIASSPSEEECRRLEQLVTAFHQFLAHDLANQLVSIQAFAQLLADQSQVQLDAEGRQIVDRLVISTRRADEQARRLSELSRLLREPPFGPPVSLSDLLTEVAARMKMQLRAARFPPTTTLTVSDVVEPLPELAVNRRLLHQVLIELLRNAIGALAPDRKGTIIVRATATPAGLELAISDNGMGFSDIRLSRLSQISAGAGFGYFFILQVVARWHGRLTIDSTPNEGTTVTLLLAEI